MTDNTERTLEIAQVFAAHDEAASKVLNAPVGWTPESDGRTAWQWIRFATGELVLATFPQGNTYLGLEAEVQADYNDALGAETAPELLLPLRSLTLTESDLHDRGLTFNTEGVTELLKVALRAKLDLLGETTSHNLPGKWQIVIGDFQVWAGELGVGWSDEFIPEQVRDRLGIRIKSDAQQAFEALSDEQKVALAAQTFQILEYDQHGHPGSHWSTDTTQALGEAFDRFGIKFTEPE